MKIVQGLGWYFPESVGGTEVYVAALAKRLRAAGHEVLVAAPEAGAAGERAYEHDGVPVFRYPIPASPTRAEARGDAVARGAERFHAWLSRVRPDVVHLHTFVTGLGLHEARAARAAGARVVATTHSSSLGFLCARGTLMRRGEEVCDGLAEPAKCAACLLQARGAPRSVSRAVAAFPGGFSRLLGRLPGRVGTLLGMNAFVRENVRRQRELFEAVDAFVVLTTWARDVVLANGAPAEGVVRNRLGHAYEAAARKPGPDTHPTRAPVRFGYLGRFDPIKGVLDLAHAVARLPRALPLRVEFRGPVASAEARAVLAELQSLLAGDDRVSFAPAVEPRETPRVLKGYDVLLCPSRCLEGGPTVAIEAHAVGTPVVGTRIGGLAELVTDGVDGRLLPPGDVGALAETLEALAKEPAPVDAWRRALPLARTMDDVARETLATYASLGAHGAGRAS